MHHHLLDGPDCSAPANRKHRQPHLGHVVLLDLRESLHQVGVVLLERIQVQRVDLALLLDFGLERWPLEILRECLSQAALALPDDSVTQVEGFVDAEVFGGGSEDLNAFVADQSCDVDCALDRIGLTFDHECRQDAVEIQIVTLDVLPGEQLGQAHWDLLHFLFDFVEVGGAVAVAAEGWELAFSAVEHFGGLVATAAFFADLAEAALDAEQIFVGGPRIFNLFFEQEHLFVLDLAQLLREVLCQSAVSRDVHTVAVPVDQADVA